MQGDQELGARLRDSVVVLRALGHPLAEVLTFERLAAADRTPAVARALGVIEGASVALGLTALELLDDHDLLS